MRLRVNSDERLGSVKVGINSSRTKVYQKIN